MHSIVVRARATDTVTRRRRHFCILLIALRKCLRISIILGCRYVATR